MKLRNYHKLLLILSKSLPTQRVRIEMRKMERYHKKRAHSFKVSSNHPFQILSDLTTGDRRQLINQIKKYLQDGKAENLNKKR